MPSPSRGKRRTFATKGIVQPRLSSASSRVPHEAIRKTALWKSIAGNGGTANIAIKLFERGFSRNDAARTISQLLAHAGVTNRAIAPLTQKIMKRYPEET